jgi:hypothetical protein
MTLFRIDLPGGLEYPIDADAVVVDPAGSLRFSTNGTVTLVIAPRCWRSVRGPGVEPLPRAPTAEPRLPLQPIRDRRAAVAERLAEVDTHR